MTKNKKEGLNIYALTGTGLCIALGLLIPYFTGHAFGLPGTIFLPMHLPVLLAGLLMGPFYGALCGLITPALSSLITRMPPVYPMLPIMVVELALYGLVSGYLYKKKKLPLLPSLLLAMVVGRLGYGLMFGLLLLFNPALKAASVVVAVTTGLPGMLIQLVLIPLLVKGVEASRGGGIPSVEQKAMDVISTKKGSCVVYNETEILKILDGRGVAPLITLLDQHEGLLKGEKLADKIIGKGAAMLAHLGGVRFVYGQIMSQSAKEYLTQNHIPYSYGRCIDVVNNRDETGICPIERSVMDINDPQEAYVAIKETIAKLQAS